MKETKQGKILKKVRLANRKRLTSVLKMLERLKEQGILFDDYGLEMPFSRQGIKRQTRDDPRAVCL